MQLERRFPGHPPAGLFYVSLSVAFELARDVEARLEAHISAVRRLLAPDGAGGRKWSHRSSGVAWPGDTAELWTAASGRSASLRFDAVVGNAAIPECIAATLRALQDPFLEFSSWELVLSGDGYGASAADCAGDAALLRHLLEAAVFEWDPALEGPWQHAAHAFTPEVSAGKAYFRAVRCQ